MTVLLVFPPRASPTYVPLGLAVLAGSARALGLTVDCLDLNLAGHEYLAREHNVWRALMKGEGVLASEAEHLSGWRQVHATAVRLASLDGKVREYLDSGALGLELRGLLEHQLELVLVGSPRVIGLSVLYPSQVPYALALAKALADRDGLRSELARSPAMEIVLGGASLSALHLEELLLACPFIDAAILKEGEAAVEALCRGVPARSVPGTAFVQDGVIVRCAPPEPVCLESAAFPDFADFDLGRYPCQSPVLAVLFSRDCRYRRCRFCAHNFSSVGYRRLSPTRFVEGLVATVSATGCRHFYLADQYIEAGDLAAISREILSRGLDVRWSVMARIEEGFTDSVLTEMRRAGCVWISWGLESGSQRVLDLAGKGASVAVARGVLVRSAQAGISNLAMMIFGLPGSDDEAFEQSAALLEELADSLDAATQSLFVLFEGTPFAKHPERYGLVIRGRSELLKVAGRPIRSMRLDFAEVASDGSSRPSRGGMEVAAWNKRRAYTLPTSFFETLVAEHYLLAAAFRADAAGYSQVESSPDIGKGLSSQ